MNQKLIVVTPAGRQRYLRLLAHYVLSSPSVHEWQLWDNCRNEVDRAFLESLAQSDARCSIKRLPGADGGFAIIGDFFRFCDDSDALYLRLDDDIVFIEEGFFERFLAQANAARGTALWFSPLVINNAICSSLIKNLSRVVIEGPISCQAMCPYSWAYPDFPKALHPVFIQAVRAKRLDDFRVPDRDVRLSRFSINAFGFFGQEKLALGDMFCPTGNGAEEEWLSAVLPAKLDRPGKILGELIVSHFSFYTQERDLLQTDILDAYYDLANLPGPEYEKPIDKVRPKDWLGHWIGKRKPAPPSYTVSLPESA